MAPRLSTGAQERPSGPYGPLVACLEARPQLAATLVRHADAVAGSGTVPRRIKELCALMVSWLNACEYCTNCHNDLAQRLGIDQATLDDLSDYARSERFTSKERAALAVAVALTREPRALPDRLWADLRADFDDGECVEIIATVGFYNYLNRLGNALQVGAMLA